MELISRQAAIDALWKSLFAYEDEMEKKFQESDELDIDEWIVHSIFVQNMSDIDRKTIRELPSAQPEIIACADCKHWICHDRRCGIWYHVAKPLDWCSYAERREE